MVQSGVKQLGWPQPRCGWFGCGTWTQGRPRSSANPGLTDATPLALGMAFGKGEKAAALECGLPQRGADPGCEGCAAKFTRGRRGWHLVGGAGSLRGSALSAWGVRNSRSGG